MSGILDYQQYLKDKEHKQKIVKERISDVLTKHGKINSHLSSEASVYVITNEIITALEEKITYR